VNNVFAIGLHAGSGGQEPRHQRLRARSQVLASVATVLLCSLVLFNAAILSLGVLFDGVFLSMGPDSTYLGEPPAGLPGIVPFASLPLPTRLAYAATLILDAAPVLFALRHLRSLLRRYAAGVVFATECGVHIKRIGLWLVAYGVAPFLGHQLVVLAGHGVDMDWFHASEVQALILGAVLFVIAQVMQVGSEIEQDRDGFV